MVLGRHVLEEARDLSGEAFTSYMDQLYDKISAQMESNDVGENLAALRDIDELIDVKLGEIASEVSKFSNHIRYIFEEKHDPEVLILGSKVLGHLARAGGAMTADEVEHHVRNALEWLRGERIEHRRFAAVLILKEMAENAPAVFYVHVPEFVDAVWVALRDPSLAVRERAVEALRACLCVMEKRETRWRVQWYYKMFEATKDGLGKNASVHSIHGSLLAVGELLRNTGEFMMSRYKEVADIVFKYREHNDRLVRHSITSLLPRIAHFLSDRFVTSYLKICMDHILAVLRIPAEWASGFVALGEMAEALDGELIHYLPTITSLIRDAIAPRRGKPSMEALACTGSLAKAMGPAMETHVQSLLDTMFSSGLSPTLVESLDQIASSLPSLLPTIQDRLLDCISVVLSKTSYHTVRSTGAAVRTSTVLSPQQALDVNDPTLIQLALTTLANFNFKGHGLLEFARDAVVIYLEDKDGSTRRDAAICCCKLVENSFPSISMLSQFTANRVGRPGGARRRILVEEVIEKLLLAAIADADVGVRKSVFASLHANGGFDEFLAQADSLRAIFIALNDEAFDIRELAISMAGRLSEKNPAYVLPALRRHLVQLLTELQQSADRKRREESAKLLGCLIRACERLLRPYIAPVHKALIAKLCESPGVSANNGVVTGVLATVGELARVGGCAMRPYVRELMPLILEALVDGAVSVKREVAVATLGQVAQSTGYVVSPYVDYPSLLSLLLRLLNGELAWSTRREVLKVLGIMGALDPHTHKRNQQSLQGSHSDGTRAMVDGGQHMRYMEDLPMDLWQSFTTSEDYFSTVAINSLMRILRDPSLSSYHQKVVGSLMFIFKSMGLASVPYLPKVLPDLFHIVHTCEGGLKDFITWKLGTLVSIVRQHIRKYLPELLALISEFWSLFSLTGICHPSAILHLMEQLCLALNDEFQAYLPEILPCCIQVLTDAERCGNYSYVPAILHTLEIFGSTLDEHTHLLLPALIRIFRPDNLNVPVEIRRAAMKTLTKLIPRVQVSGHISALIQPLSLVLDGTPYWQGMIDAVSICGAGFKAPTEDDLSGPLLLDMVEEMKLELEDHKKIWSQKGCTIMTDGWTDKRSRILLNFLVSSGGKILMERHPKIFWTLCAAHCIDLMLEDIGKLVWVKSIVTQDKNLCKFIYNHALVLNTMRQYTKGKELARPGITRFASNFITLKSLLTSRLQLRCMFVGPEWSSFSFATSPTGIDVTKCIYDDEGFWEPCLKIVDGKSSLVAALSQTDLYIDDKLFATLDPRVRSIFLPSGQKVLLSDTVGFISDLPVQLVEAFQATLEEVTEADLLMHVIDVSAPNAEEHRDSVLDVLQQIGVSSEKLENMIEVWNKVDLLESDCESIVIAEHLDHEKLEACNDEIPLNISANDCFLHEADVTNESTNRASVSAEEVEDTETNNILTKNINANLSPKGFSYVKASATTGTGLQELLHLLDEKLDEKLKPAANLEDKYFVKWRPSLSEAASD